jgi:hypothetical protein
MPQVIGLIAGEGLSTATTPGPGFFGDLSKFPKNVLGFLGLKPPDVQSPQAVTPQIQQAQKAAIGQQLPGLQAQVGGSVSPEYYLQMAQLGAGTTNQPGSAASAWDSVSQYFGLGSPGLTTNTGTSSGGLTAGATTGAGTSSIVSDGIKELMGFMGLGGNQPQALTA